MMRLLLLSNSTCHGQGYLDHCADDIAARLEGVGRLLFVPYALFDRDGYADAVTARFERLGVAVDSIHRQADPRRAVDEAAAFFVGGGNTFRLLRELYRLDLLEPIRRRVTAGVPYLGSSAGSNIAGATIRTTNDMPIVEPPSFDALGLVPFNLNPHYLDATPDSTHMGETREERILQFHEENDLPVVALREGTLLRRDGDQLELLGAPGGRLFRRDQETVELAAGSRLDELLAPS